MKNNTAAAVASENVMTYKVYGTVRNLYQQPMQAVTVKAFNKGMRDRQSLGEATTAVDGTYAIAYTLENIDTAALVIGVYDAKNALLKEGAVQYEVPAELQADIDLSDRPFAGIATYDQLLSIIAPFTREVPLSNVTETDVNPDISFIVQKTGLTRKAVEKLAMSARFETFSAIPACVWYGLLSSDLSVADPTANVLRSGDYETRLSATFDRLMHTAVNTLVSLLQKAIEGNIIAYAVSADLDKITTQLSAQLLDYANQHPVTGAPSAVHQKAQLAGLKGNELQAFIQLKNTHSGADDGLWLKARETAGLSAKKTDALEVIFYLSKLAGNNLPLIDNLVKTHKIASPADIKKLAAYSTQDWEEILKKHSISPDASIPGKNGEEKVQNYAAQLEAIFSSRYPAAAFAARLQNDTGTKLPHLDKVKRFLQKNQDFDLLTHHVGTFIEENKNAVPEKDVAIVSDHVRRIQRVAKLTTNYNSAAVLLDADIHSASQVHKMGQDNFVKAYSDKLGEPQATKIFENATAIHAAATALTGNLRSMTDASSIKAFPDFKAAITKRLAQDLPSLDSLFGHTDYCDCQECNSVYGAPAYLTDILHYLDKRNSSLPATNLSSAVKKIPSVKDILLKRRPDIGDIDLGCDNTNTQVPYIDISCEIMEDYIAPPVITIPIGTLFPLLVKGTINTALLTPIKAQFNATGQISISNLLTAAATVSDQYTVNHLQADNTYLTQSHWIIRDSQITLRASFTFGQPPLELRVVHQTLLSADVINAGPEYININVYANFLKTAKTPFTLPFDLFETEGELYLEKLGVKKADLINIFRKEDKLAPGASPTDIKVAYAGLGINEAEQALIFTADPNNQSLYWGAAATSATIQVDVFEKLTGLNYSQVANLVQLQFINPAKDTTIEHDDLIPNVTTQRLSNITGVKLDAMHRFLRLWRKTTLTMDELDAIIMASLIGQGKIANKLALQLYQFTMLQQKLQLSAFQLLAFYQNIDTTHSLPACLYNQMFQNGGITNPVSTNFTISAATPGTLSLAEADKAVIAAVLQVSISDVNLLITKTVSRISFPALSVMYRFAQLARSLNLAITDLFKLLNLIDANPFQDLQSTCLFLQKYKLMQSSGFAIDELNYVLRHQDDSNHTLVPATGTVTSALGQLQGELLVARATTQPAPDVDGALLTKWLSDGVFKWDRGLLSKVAYILNTTDNAEYQQKIDDNTNLLLNLRMVYHDAVITADLAALPLTTSTFTAPIVFPSSIASQLCYDADKKLLKLTGYMSTADKNGLLALSTDTAYQAAVNVLFNTAQLTDSSSANVLFAATADVTNLRNILDGRTADRFAVFINKLSPVYKKLQQQNILIKDVSSWFTIDKKVVAQLLTSVPAIYTDFTDDNFVNKVVALNNPAQINRYLFAAKACFIAGKLKLTDTDIAFMLSHAADINSLNFLTLPLAPVSGSTSSFPAFEALINLLRFQQYNPAKIIDTANNTTLSIYTILADAIAQGTLTGAALMTYTATLVANLSLLTGWSPTDLVSLISTPNNLALVLPADLKSVPILMRLQQRFVVLQQLGISAIDAFAWIKDSLLAADTAKIKQVLKQKYTNSDWLQISPPLQNTLREKKRDALIAYLLANPGTQTWKNTDDLYSYFLLDVEMCSCQPTSRVVQATNTVQLFVQRCFLGLEDSILVDSKADSDWLQWQWMKNFRIWQANVKVFLYPENYIEPELLPVGIKSSFFSDLENDLLQGELTANAAETAFQNYLEKLSSTARLEIKGMWYDDPSKTLHVFGRTYGGDPKIYYYRKFIENRRWTPWEKVTLDITGEWIMPVVYNNHVYLFWAIFKDGTAQDGSKNWQIQLAYSEYKNGKWAGKKISENNDSGQIICDKASFPDITRFFFSSLDIPLFDFSKIISTGDFAGAVVTTHSSAIAAYLQTIKVSVIQNGALVISLHYKGSSSSFEGTNYIDSFQLDIAKGYPVKIHIPSWFGFGGSDRFKISTTTGPGNMINMYETEIVASSAFSIPNQSRGKYTKLMPLQMGLQERADFILDVPAGSGITSGLTATGFLLPHFYQDQLRTYYVSPEFTNDADFVYRYEDQVKLTLAYLDNNSAYYTPIINRLRAGNVVWKNNYANFYHPMIGNFMQRLFINGVDGLMDRETQLQDNASSGFNFSTYYNDMLTATAGRNQSDLSYPIENVDFSLQSGYGLYNWELFFHAPLMIAERLSQNQQFDDADRWYRYIFNPMDTSANSAPSKYWNTKPFFAATGSDYTNQQIGGILKGISSGTQDLLQDVTDWRNNPFQPHYIAEYRTVAYQKTVVMKYVGHLIRYGDYLFNQDTMESVNQATQLYLLAAEILGPKPELIPSVAKTAVDNYYQLEQKLDAMSDALVNVENLLPFETVKGYTGIQPGTGLPGLQTAYFCTPANESMTGPTGYWDTVADRLFKIRHCLNIDGTAAPLSLFAPVIDPGLLVRATAAGLDIGSILTDINSPLPFYRFAIMIQKAIQLVNEVKSLGSLMLSVLEKKDAEAIALLRSGQEIKILNAVVLLKQKQIDEAQATLDSLNKQKELTGIRQKYYAGLISHGLNTSEKAALGLNFISTELDAVISLSYLFASGAAAAPTVSAGALASPTAGGALALVSDGGLNAAEGASSLGRNLGSIAAGLDKAASLIAANSGYARRAEEWQYQLDLANKELEQIEKQIAGAQIRADISAQDLSNQQLMIDQAGETNDFMHSKFTNDDLFNWMITQTSTTYFRSYQMAYDIAKQAERCFRYELGLGSSSYINFGYWDSLKKGLLAGEQLSYDLNTMEMAYYEQNKRELELTKPISLSQLDPVALLKLKTTRECWVNLPEELFDMDYPGHFMRRIKSVSLTIPCISGPYTAISCNLTMTKNSVRTSSVATTDASQYSRKLSNGLPTDDTRFRDAVGALQSIATSSAQNDSGLFELNFRDERYLPFEGAGAISQWHIELPAAMEQFDYDTISDVIINLKYTARDGGEALKANAKTSLDTKINQMLVSTKDTGLMRIFSAKNDLATEWYRFLNPVNATDDQVLTVALDKSRFPLFVQNKAIRIKAVELVADSGTAAINGLVVNPAPTAPAAINLTATGIYGSNLSVSMDYSNDPGTWLIKNPVANARVTAAQVNNLVIIVHYEIS